MVNILADSKICEKSPVTGPRRVGAESEGQPLSTFQVHVLEILMLRRFYFKYQRIPLLIKSLQKCQTPTRVVRSVKLGYQSIALLMLGDTIGLSD